MRPSASYIHSDNTVIINRPSSQMDCNILFGFGKLIEFFISNMPKLKWKPVLKKYLIEDEMKVALSWVKLSMSTSNLMSEIRDIIEEGPSIFAQSAARTQIGSFTQTKISNTTASTKVSDRASTAIHTSSDTRTQFVATRLGQEPPARELVEQRNFTYQNPFVGGGSLPIMQTPEAMSTNSNTIKMQTQPLRINRASDGPRDVTSLLIPKTHTKLGNRT